MPSNGFIHTTEVPFAVRWLGIATVILEVSRMSDGAVMAGSKKCPV